MCLVLSSIYLTNFKQSSAILYYGNGIVSMIFFDISESGMKDEEEGEGEEEGKFIGQV